MQSAAAHQHFCLFCSAEVHVWQPHQLPPQHHPPSLLQAAAPPSKAGAEQTTPGAADPAGKVGKGKAAKGKADSKAADKAKGAASNKDKPVDVSRVDLRVGLITTAKKHPDADSLYVEDIMCGEEAPRVVVSGLVKHIPEAEMQQRLVVVVANLKPANLKGIKSHAMVLAATGADGKVRALRLLLHACMLAQGVCGRRRTRASRTRGHPFALRCRPAGPAHTLAGADRCVMCCRAVCGLQVQVTQSVAAEAMWQVRRACPDIPASRETLARHCAAWSQRCPHCRILWPCSAGSVCTACPPVAATVGILL